jgi:hypothetical protein
MPENKEQEPLDQPSADGCFGCALVVIVAAAAIAIIWTAVYLIIKFV